MNVVQYCAVIFIYDATFLWHIIYYIELFDGGKFIFDLINVIQVQKMGSSYPPLLSFFRI